MRLVVMMLKVAPASSIARIVRKNLLRSIMNAAGNKTNHLHDLSVQVLADMVTAVADDPKCSLELASALIKEGDLNFDKRTSTTTVLSLVQGMDKQTLMEQIDVLERVISEGRLPTKSDGKTAEDDVDTPSSAAAALQSHLTAMDTLINIARNPGYVTFKCLSTCEVDYCFSFLKCATQVGTHQPSGDALACNSVC